MHTTFTIYQKEPGKFLKLSELIKGRVYYKNYYLCLVTNEKYQYSIETFFSELRNKIEFNPKRIIHLFYELDLKSLISMPENEILAIDLIYKDSLDREKEEKSPNIELNIIEKPDKTEYTQRFNYVQENLSRGNCYQVNLTQRYRYKID